MLRRYVLGLSLVSFTASAETFLREGCQLVPDADRPAEWCLVRHDGRREPMSLSHNDALKYAQEAAENFGVGPARKTTFNPRLRRQRWDSPRMSEGGPVAAVIISQRGNGKNE